MAGTRKKSWEECVKLVALIKELMHHGNVKDACKKVKAGRGWVYGWRQRNPEFRDVFEDARACGIEVLKDEAHRRAYTGILEPQFYQGEEFAKVRKYSDTLLMFLIKQADPTYREHYQIDHAQAGSRPFVFQLALHPDAVKAHKEAS